MREFTIAPVRIVVNSLLLRLPLPIKKVLWEQLCFDKK